MRTYLSMKEDKTGNQIKSYIERLEKEIKKVHNDSKPLMRFIIESAKTALIKKEVFNESSNKR